MESSSQTQSSLRARIAQLEQQLQDTATANQTVKSRAFPTSTRQKKVLSTTDDAVKKAKYAQPSTKNWSNYKSALGSKKINSLSKSLGKTFKWTAPAEPLHRSTPQLSVSNPARVDAVDKLIRRKSSIPSTTCVAPSTSLSKLLKYDTLLAKMKSIDKIVTSKYNVVLNNDIGGTTNRMNTSWTSSNVPKEPLNLTSASESVRNSTKISNKWANNNATESRRKNSENVSVNLHTANSSQLTDPREDTENMEYSRNSRKRKGEQSRIISKRQTQNLKSWTKKDEDFTFIPIIKDRSCLFFNKFGKCRMGSKCVFEHDSSKIAICRLYLQNRCGVVNCLLSHCLQQEKMPDCEYFEKGICFKDNCVYRHVKFNDDAKICDDFTKGYCSSGLNCSFRHVIQGGVNANKKMNIHITNKTKTKKKINSNSPDEVRMNILTDSPNFVDSFQAAGAPSSSIDQATETSTSTVLVETDLFIPFSSVGTLSANSMLRGAIRKDQIAFLDEDAEECAEYSETAECEEIGEEKNAEEIDGGQENADEEEDGEIEEFISGDDDDEDKEVDIRTLPEVPINGSHQSDGNDDEDDNDDNDDEDDNDDSDNDDDDDDIETEDRNDKREKDEERIRHNLSMIKELQDANILQYIPKCIYS